MARKLHGVKPRFFARAANLYDPMSQDVLDLYDELLAGEDEVSVALRAQLRSQLVLGVTRSRTPGELRVVTVYDESCKDRFAVPGLRGQLLEVGDAVVQWEDGCEAEAVLSINDGVVTELLLTGGDPPSDWRPSRVSFGDREKRARVWAAVADEARSHSSTGEAAPEWLLRLSKLPLRQRQLTSDNLAGAPLAVQDLGRWIEPTQFGSISLHSGQEFYELEEQPGRWVIASDIDGSPLVVENGSRVLRLGVDGTEVVEHDSLPDWLQRLVRESTSHEPRRRPRDDGGSGS